MAGQPSLTRWAPVVGDRRLRAPGATGAAAHLGRPESFPVRTIRVTEVRDRPNERPIAAAVYPSATAARIAWSRSHAREYATLDRAGRVQLPREMTRRLGMRNRVELQEEPDHIGVWPDQAADQERQ